jgi:hypothetical protein
MAEHAADRALPPVRHEAKDVGLFFALWLFALIGVTLLLLIALAYLLFPGEVKDQRFAEPFPAYPSPKLQQSPHAEMQVFYAREMQQLNSVGWLNRSAGTVHMPIGQAMRAVAAEGIPGWPSAGHRSQEPAR